MEIYSDFSYTGEKRLKSANKFGWWTPMKNKMLLEILRQRRQGTFLPAGDDKLKLNSCFIWEDDAKFCRLFQTAKAAKLNCKSPKHFPLSSWFDSYYIKPNLFFGCLSPFSACKNTPFEIHWLLCHRAVRGILVKSLRSQQGAYRLAGKQFPDFFSLMTYGRL